MNDQAKNQRVSFRLDDQLLERLKLHPQFQIGVPMSVIIRRILNDSLPNIHERKIRNQINK